MTNIMAQRNQLLQASAEDATGLVSIGRRHGAEALSDMLDALSGGIGGEFYVQTAENFFKGLAKPFRDADIITHCKGGDDTALFATKHNISENRVREIIRNSAREVE